MTTPYFPSLGFGLGLRPEHYPHYENGKPAGIDWVEAITENYLPWEDGRIRRSLSVLEKVRRDMPVVLHGVSMSLGSTDPVNLSYIDRLSELIERVQPSWVSDHLCWTGVHGRNLHDLLPLPYTEEAVALVSRKIREVQDRLKRRIVIENVSSYVEFGYSTMNEWEFLSEVSKRADCGILLDVNNIFVSSVNHDFEALDYVKGVPLDRVAHVHLAGHENVGPYRIDTHDNFVCPEVWELYRWVSRKLGPVSTLLEWDDKFPAWDVLLVELNKAREIEKDERNSSGRVARKVSGVPEPTGRAGTERAVTHPTHSPGADRGAS